MNRPCLKCLRPMSLGYVDGGKTLTEVCLHCGPPGRVSGSVTSSVSLPEPQKPSKYRSQVTTCQKGHQHDSAKESRRCDELHLMQVERTVYDLEIQPKYVLEVKGKKVCTWTADFRYLDEWGHLVIEDVKSSITRTNPAYRIKVKLFTAIYGIKVLET